MATPTLSLRCLGPFLIDGASGWNLLPSFKKGREFVEYLSVYADAFIPRERLLDAFWRDDAGEQLKHRLHLAASAARAALRAALGGFDPIVCTGGGYRWHPALVLRSDVQRFFECARAPGVDSAREGVSLYGGDLLCGERAQWISPPRVRCATLYVSMLLRLASDSFAAHDYQTALEYALHVAEVDRGDEAASRLIMRCHAALGRRHAARAEYDAFAEFLADELGVKPMPETQNTLADILSR